MLLVLCYECSCYAPTSTQSMSFNCETLCSFKMLNIIMNLPFHVLHNITISFEISEYFAQIRLQWTVSPVLRRSLFFPRCLLKGLKCLFFSQYNGHIPCKNMAGCVYTICYYLLSGAFGLFVSL